MDLPQSTIPGRPPWTFGPLYDFLFDIFPEYRTKRGFFDVQKFRLEVKKSHEAVYKWLRSGKLTPANARLICEIANRHANVDSLSRSGRTPPTEENFLPFVFAE